MNWFTRRSKTIKFGNFRLKAFWINEHWRCMIQKDMWHGHWKDLFLTNKYSSREYALDAGVDWIKKQRLG